MTSEITNTDDVLTHIAKGWNTPHEVYGRAALMRRHAEGGNHQRAMEYACEIVSIQDAMLERDKLTTNTMPAYMTKAHLLDWADCLTGGGYLAGPNSYAMRAHVAAAFEMDCEQILEAAQ